jgi:hypothetical protein
VRVKRRWLAPALRGEAVGALAITEPTWAVTTGSRSS